MEENNRKDKIKNSLLDTATDEITNAGNEAVKVVLRDIKDWLFHPWPYPIMNF